MNEPPPMTQTLVTELALQIWPLPPLALTPAERLLFCLMQRPAAGTTCSNSPCTLCRLALRLADCWP